MNHKPTYISKSKAPIRRGILPPNAETISKVYPIQTIDGKVTQESLDVLNSGKITLYIYGKTTYDDILNKSHWTIFYYIYNPRFGGYLMCDEHNDSDK